MKKIALYLAGLLLTASCIYTFEPETPPVDRCLVFEGNLVIGESSTMAVRLLQPLSGSIVTDTDTSFGVVTMWILGDLGSDTIEEYEDDLVLKNIDGTYYICCD